MSNVMKAVSAPMAACTFATVARVPPPRKIAARKSEYTGPRRALVIHWPVSIHVVAGVRYEPLSRDQM